MVLIPHLIAITLALFISTQVLWNKITRVPFPGVFVYPMLLIIDKRCARQR